MLTLPPVIMSPGAGDVYQIPIDFQEKGMIIGPSAVIIESLVVTASPSDGSLGG